MHALYVSIVASDTSVTQTVAAARKGLLATMPSMATTTISDNYYDKNYDYNKDDDNYWTSVCRQLGMYPTRAAIADAYYQHTSWGSTRAAIQTLIFLLMSSSASYR
jgi:hypothetical protein